VDGDLNGQNLVVEEGGGVFQVGPTESFVHRIEVSFADLRATGNELNLGGSWLRRLALPGKP